MEIKHSHLDLDELGFIDSYEISGEKGELNYEFPPLDYKEGDMVPIALVVVDGDPEHLPEFELNEEEYHGYEKQEPSKTGITAIFPEFVNRMTARFKFPGGKPITLHFAVFRRIRKSFSDLVIKAINRFEDKCWACKKLVKFFISLLVSGGLDESGKTLGEFFWDILPKEMGEGILDTEFGEMLKKIVGYLEDFFKGMHKYDPRNIIAERVCIETGYCARS